jgi:hypothetical protein
LLECICQNTDIRLGWNTEDSEFLSSLRLYVASIEKDPIIDEAVVDKKRHKMEWERKLERLASKVRNYRSQVRGLNKAIQHRDLQIKNLVNNSVSNDREKKRLIDKLAEVDLMLRSFGLKLQTQTGSEIAQEARERREFEKLLLKVPSIFEPKDK